MKVKRHTIIIKKAFQIKIALLALSACIIMTLLVGIDIYLTINNQLYDAFNIDPEFSSTLMFVNNLLVFKMIVYCLIIFAGSFFLSHKLAGPLFNFEKSCRVVGEGDLTCRVYLRKYDSMQDLQNDFNNMVKNLQSKLLKIDHLCRALESSGQPGKAREIRSELVKQFKLS